MIRARTSALCSTLALGLLLTSGCGQPREAAQPTALPGEAPPRIFRSTLDGRTRVLTARLDERLWAAWDVEQAALFAVWPGGVDLDGAVYTGAHGPQPTSRGKAWLVGRYAAPWRVLVAGREHHPEVRYGGHRILPDGVALSYDLLATAGSVSIGRYFASRVSTCSLARSSRPGPVESSTVSRVVRSMTGSVR